MERPNPIPFYDGPIEWYQVNERLRTVSYKIKDQIGCTRKFAINTFETKEETEIRVRETIAGYDRYDWKYAENIPNMLYFKTT